MPPSVKTRIFHKSENREPEVCRQNAPGMHQIAYEISKNSPGIIPRNPSTEDYACVPRGKRERKGRDMKEVEEEEEGKGKKREAGGRAGT